MTQEFKTYIKAAFDFCLHLTFHSEYQLIYKWMGEAHKSDGDGTSTKMEVKIDTVYLFLTIYVYPQMEYHWENKDWDLIGDYVLHEVCHLLIEPVAKLFMWDACESQRSHYRDTIERQTQRTTNALLRALPNGWATPGALKVVGENAKEEKEPTTKETLMSIGWRDGHGGNW